MRMKHEILRNFSNISNIFHLPTNMEVAYDEFNVSYLFAQFSPRSVYRLLRACLFISFRILFTCRPLVKNNRNLYYPKGDVQRDSLIGIVPRVIKFHAADKRYSFRNIRTLSFIFRTNEKREIKWNIIYRVVRLKCVVKIRTLEIYNC